MARERRGSRTRLLALEPRVLFDGALAEAAIATTLLQGTADPAPASDPLLDALVQASAAAPTTTTSAETQLNEIVFVDTTVADHQQLLAAIANPDARVVLLDPSRDAIEQMASFMDGMNRVTAVHVISHGTSGQLVLGGQAYSAERLDTEYSGQLARIGRGLSADGDILLYGCEIGQGSAGESFLRQVAQETGADVAASNDKTGAASLGGNWTLEAQAGLVEARAVIDADRAAGYDHLLATVDVSGVLMNFTGATLQSGTALSVGAVYKFTNVTTVAGVQVDAYITISGMTNATLNSMDNAGPGGYNAGSSGVGAGQLWAPVISTTATNGRVDFSISFRDTSNNPHTLLNLKANAISVDSVSAGVDEFVEAGGYQSYTRSAGGTPTTLGASLGPGDRVRVFQGSGTQLAGLVVNDANRVQFNFGPVSTIQLSMGVGGVVSNRQMAIAFTPIAFASGSTDIVAPTVNALSTSDTTPLLTGTIGTTPIGSDTFTVTVNGTTYTTASGVTIVGTDWSLNVPTALSTGTYDVRAVRNAGGLPIVDQTATELTITPSNNAPALDNSLSPVFNTTEDAGVPSGAVGSLVSSLTAGASDADAGASKGVAVVGADTANGTWYYSTNGGTNWSALGAVSNASARLLADDGNTRLYFAPNANYNGTSAAAITFRAWDQTTGTNGGTADTSGANSGGTTAFSTATDTADVNVAAVNDAPTADIVPASFTVNEQTTLGLQGVMTVSDIDAGSAAVRVTISVSGGGVLFASAGTTGVTVSGFGTASLVLDGTLAQINSLLAGASGSSMNYVHPSDNPPATDTLTLAFSDLGNTGSGGILTASDSATINITPLNDVVGIDLDTGSAGSNAAVTFTEQTAVRIATNAVLGDPDSPNLAWLTATLAARPDGDAVESLALNATGTTIATSNGLTVSYTAATGVLSISGSASRGAYLSLIQSIVYNNASDTPSTPDRSVSIVLNDGEASSVARTSTITVVPVNDTPVADLNGGGAGNDGTASFTEQTPVLIAPSATLADVDSASMASMTVTLTARPNGAMESLSLNPAANAAATGLTVSYDSATGVLSITGSASRATYETILQGIQYNNTSDAPDTTSRGITVVVNDGGTNSVTRTVTVGVTAENDAPLATLPGPYATTEQTPLALQGTGISVSDVDAGAGAVRATLQVLNGSTLTVNAGSTGVTVTGSGTRTVVLDGTVAAINNLLAGNGGATISHIRNSDTATADVLQLSVTDLGNTGTGGPLTSVASLPITITTVNDAPTLSGPAATLTYTENGAPTAIDTSVTVTDPDLGSFNGGFVQAAFTAGGTIADQLSVLNQGNGAGQIGVSGSTVSYGGVAIGTIDATLNGANGVALRITLNASANATATEALACAIAFSNSSDAPSTTARTVTFTLDDGGNGGGAALQGTRTATVNLTAVNDAPVADITPPSYTYIEGLSGALQGTGLAISDVDAGNAVVRATLSAGSPTTINVFAGTTGVTVTGSGTNSVTLEGTVTQINDLLAGNLGATIGYVGDFNGVSGVMFTDTLTLTVDDLGNGGSGGPQTHSDTATMHVAAVNDPPVNTVPAAQGTNEDTPLVFSIANGNAVSVSDTDADTLQVQVSVTNGILTLAGTTGLTFNAGANGSATMTVTGTKADINAALNGLTYTPTANYSGPATLTVSTSDLGATGAGGAQTDTDTVTITVNAVNSAPVAAGGNTSVTATEDTALSGNLPTAVDPEGDAFTYAKASDPANGTVVVNADGTYTYTPAANYFGADSFTYTISDGSASNTYTVSITVNPVNDAPAVDLNGGAAGNGNSVSFTEQTPVMIAPSATLADLDSANLNSMTVTLTARPNGAMESLSLNGAASAAAAGLTVSYNAGTGVLSITGSASRATYQTILQGIQYNNTSDAPDTANRSITVAVNDGSADSATQTVTVGVTAVNDAPVPNISIWPGYSFVEGVSAQLHATGLSIADVDAGSGTVRATLGVGSGTIDVLAGTTGVTVTNSGTGSVTLEGTVAQINNLLAGNLGATAHYTGQITGVYTGVNFADTLTLAVNDLGNSGSGGAQTASTNRTIWVWAMNDPPVNTVPAAQSTNEDTPVVFSAANGNALSVDDVDALTLQVQLSVTNGILTLAGTTGLTFNAGANGSSTMTVTGTKADINAALNGLTYTPTANYAGPATLTVFTSDLGSNGDGGTQTDTDTVTITVNAVNDAPVAANTSVTATENVPLNGSLPAAVDAEGDPFTYAKASDPTNGTVVVNADGTYTYTPAADYFGPDSFTYTVSDGSASNTYTVSITVNDTPEVDLNGGAAGNGNSASFIEQTPVLIAPSATLADIDSANLGSMTVTLTARPNGAMESLSLNPAATAAAGGLTVNYDSATGVLSITGSASKATYQTILQGIQYNNTSDTPDTTSRSITVVLNDGSANSATQTVTVGVTAVNDAPVASIYTSGYSIWENSGAVTFPSLDLYIADVDAGNAPVRATLSATSGTFDVTVGATGVTVTGSGTTSITLEGTVAQINALLTTNLGGDIRYTPHITGVYAGAVITDPVTLTVDDLGNSGSGGAQTASTSTTMWVWAINDPPVNTVPVAQSTGEDTPLVFSAANGNALSVSDIDALTLQVQISVTNGVLTLASTTGLTFNAGANGSSTMTVTGNKADINAALNGLSYTPTANYTGAATLTVFTSDLGSNGAGGTQTDTDTVAITVNAVNDAPTATITPASFTVNEQTTLDLRGVMSVADIDAGSAPIRVTLQVNTGVLFATAGTTGVTVSGFGTNTLVLDGTLAQINDLLSGAPGSGMNYFHSGDTPPPTDNLTLTVSDLGNTGAGGVQTASTSRVINITPINDAPLIDLDTGSASADVTASFTEQIPVRLASSILLADPDSANMGSLTATLAARPDGDGVESLSLSTSALATAASNGLTVTYTASTGVLSITGSASRGVYGTMLRGIFYNNTSDTPSTVDRTVTVMTNDGAVDSTARTVTVSVTAVNDAPTAGNTAITVAEDTLISGSLPAAADAEGDPVTYAKASDPANGTVVVNADGTYTYTPGANYAGTDSFTYTVSDGSGGSNTYTVNVTVTPVNDAPTVPGGNIGITVGDGTPTNGSLPAAVDIDGDPVTYTKATDPANGTVVVNPDGTYTYTPAPGYLGPDSFTYTVSDGNGGSNTYTVSVTVIDVTAPLLANQSFTYFENRGTGDVLGSVAASDNSGAVTGFRFVASDGTPLGATSQDGYFIVDGAGRITLTPAGAAAGAAPNDFEIGTHSFSYGMQARDGAGNWSAAGTVTLTVADVDDIAPQIGPGQAFQLPQGTGTQIGQVSATDNVGVTDFRFTGTGTNVSADGFFTISNTGVISLTPAGAAASAMDRDFWTNRSTFGEAVQARDSAGNWSSSVVVNFHVEDVAQAPDDEDERVAVLTRSRPAPGDIVPPQGNFAGTGADADAAGGADEGLVLPSADVVASAGARGWPVAGEPILFGGSAHERPAPSRLVNIAAQTWAAQSRSIDRLPEPDDRLARHGHVEPADLGFVLLRLAVRDLGSPGMMRRDMLVRYRRVPDPVFPAGSGMRFVVPADAFAHTNPSAVVRLHATLASDKPLPQWLEFDGVVGVLHGRPPKDFRGVLQIHITARDNQGLQASTKFNMTFGDPHSAEMPPETIADTVAPAVPAPVGTGTLHLAGLGVDAVVVAGLRTAARRRPKEEGPAGDGGAAGFTDQLRRVQARGGARTDDNLLWALRGEQAERPWGA